MIGPGLIRASQKQESLRAKKSQNGTKHPPQADAPIKEIMT